MRSSSRILLVLALLSSPSLAATDVYVDAIHGSDATGAGTLAAPYRTITAGLRSLGGSGSHTVHAAPGLYDRALGENFPLVLGDDLSLVGAGAHETVIAGHGGDVTLVELRRRSLVSDVTVRSAGVGIESPPAAAFALHYVRRCAIEQCDVGVFAYDAPGIDHGLVIASSVIAANGVGLRAQAPVCVVNSVSVLVYGTTITGNVVGLEALQPPIACELYLYLYNSIVRGNANDSIKNWSPLLSGVQLSHGNVLSEPSMLGFGGNVNVDPLLAEGAAGDAHLAGISPVVDLAASGPPWPPSAAWIEQGWIWESSFAAVGDIDGGARIVGAKVDPGADERVVPALYPWLEASIGGAFELRGVAQPSDQLAVYLSAALADPPLLGFVALQPPWFALGPIVCGANGFGSATVAVPNAPELVGVDVHFQAARLLPSGVDVTNPVSIRIWP